MTSAPNAQAVAPDDPFGMVDLVAHHARFAPGKLAVRDLTWGQAFTYAEFDARIDRCAALLQSLLGEPEGERVAVLAHNRVDLLTLEFACVRAGAVYVPLNWRLAAAELSVLVQDCTPRLLFVDEAFQATADQLTGAHSIERVLSIDVAPFDAALDAAPVRPTRPRPARADQPSILLYTSGTTGRPKGVILTERTCFASTLNFAIASGLAADTVFLCEMPLFHVAGLIAAARSPLLNGGTILIGQRFDPEAAFARISDPALGVTHIFYVAQMTQTLREHPGYKTCDFSRIRALITGGAPNPPANIARWIDDGIPMIDGFGMTEIGTGFAMPMGDLELLKRKAGASGLPTIMLRARLVDADEQEVTEPGKVGEIRLKGPNVTPGYWRQPEATAASFDADGWFKSGDVGYRDADGFYFLVDRLKDMFISGGENVYPTEIENVIAELDVVSEAAVIAVPDERWGEVGLAYVVPVPGASIAPEAVLEHVRARLARYKAPKSVIVTDRLPRTASGKLQKNVLRERAKAEMAGVMRAAPHHRRG